MSFISTVVTDLKFALTHPATVRKELIATATTVAADVTFFTSFTHASGLVMTGATAVTAACTFLLSFLGSNASPEDVTATAPLKVPDIK